MANAIDKLESLVEEVQEIEPEMTILALKTLVHIAKRSGEIGVLELMPLLGISDAACSRNWRYLRERGLVVSEGSPSDERKKVLSLTSKGQRKVEAMKKLFS